MQEILLNWYKKNKRDLPWRKKTSWYKTFLQSEDGLLFIETFNEEVAEYEKITDIKKVDFILWQTRA